MWEVEAVYGNALRKRFMEMMCKMTMWKYYAEEARRIVTLRNYANAMEMRNAMKNSSAERMHKSVRLKYLLCCQHDNWHHSKKHKSW